MPLSKEEKRKRRAEEKRKAEAGDGAALVRRENEANRKKDAKEKADEAREDRLAKMRETTARLRAAPKSDEPKKKKVKLIVSQDDHKRASQGKSIQISAPYGAKNGGAWSSPAWRRVVPGAGSSVEIEYSPKPGLPIACWHKQFQGQSNFASGDSFGFRYSGPEQMPKTLRKQNYARRDDEPRCTPRGDSVPRCAAHVDDA